MLSRHPLNPDRPYLSWQRKLRIQLDALLAVPNPDTHTRTLIYELQKRFPVGLNKKKRRIK